VELSRNAWTSQPARLAHTSHRPCTSRFALPAMLTDGNYAQTARGVRAGSTLPPLPVSMGVSSLTYSLSMMISVFRSSAHFTAQAVCPCQGSRLNDLLLGLCLKCPKKICSASWIRLDNSYPPRSSRQLSGKQIFMLTINRRNVSSVVLLASALASDTFAPLIGW
jgi:hypothetical protein